jgi:hypothetical protein
MIVRIATFPGQPDRFTTGHAYRYVIETLRDTPGCVAAYHLAGADNAVSVSIWDDEQVMAEGEARLAEVRDSLDIPSSPPPEVARYTVAAST